MEGGGGGISEHVRGEHASAVSPTLVFNRLARPLTAIDSLLLLTNLVVDENRRRGVRAQGV